MTKRLLPFILFYSFTIAGAAQDRKDLKLSVSAGGFNSSYYQNAKPGVFYNVAMEYFFRKRHSLSAEYTNGKFNYYDTIYTNNPIPLTVPGYAKHTNTEDWVNVFALLYKYKFVDKPRLSVSAGTGLGMITNVIQYYKTNATSGSPEDDGSKADLCFPVRLDIDLPLSKKFQVGLTGGVYVYPDYPLLGEHVGLRLSYILQ